VGGRLGRDKEVRNWVADKIDMTAEGPMRRTDNPPTLSTLYYAPRGLPTEYDWLVQTLELSFREHHQKLKAALTNSEEIDGLSGIDFEMWIAKFLKREAMKCTAPQLRATKVLT
jgi:hypothetical protein